MLGYWGYLVTNLAGRSVPGDVVLVPWPVQGGLSPLKHRGDPSVSRVEVFKDLLSQGLGDDWAVI